MFYCVELDDFIWFDRRGLVYSSISWSCLVIKRSNFVRFYSKEKELNFIIIMYVYWKIVYGL